jgi:hypothetical protein
MCVKHGRQKFVHLHVVVFSERAGGFHLFPPIGAWLHQLVMFPPTFKVTTPPFFAAGDNSDSRYLAELLLADAPS